MKVYVAYADDEIGLPVAMGDTVPELAAQLGLTPVAVWKLLKGDSRTSKGNRIGVPLTIHRVELDFDEDEGEDDGYSSETGIQND
jgi:hypothetical protein